VAIGYFLQFQNTPQKKEHQAKQSTTKNYEHTFNKKNLKIVKNM